jgi:pyrimidine-nucleoside phosphorylase
MMESGDVLDLTTAGGPFVDKHSTGGVGDKVSLILAPMVAACGVKVPMMSGRGLGHTGGTLDKLQSIPGYRIDLSLADIHRGLAEVGYVMIGQSATLVPADRRMYALRDVTGTVESIPLITASILSKKLAEGAEALVLDVKCGAGAFMRDLPSAEELARSLVRTGKSLGRQVVAVITDMDAPLGRFVGNFVEVVESIECLRGGGPRDLVDLCVRLGAWMLLLARVETNLGPAERRLRGTLEDGSAWERFLANVRLQGGDVEFCLHPERGPRPAATGTLAAARGGVVRGLDARKVGVAALILGAGRERAEDRVLPEAGIQILCPPGAVVEPGQPLCVLHTDSPDRLRRGLDTLEEAYSIEEGPPWSPGPRVLRELSEA